MAMLISTRQLAGPYACTLCPCQHCSEKHLQRYINEFDFRYNSRDITDWERAAKALEGIEGKRLTYRRAAIGANV